MPCAHAPNPRTISRRQLQPLGGSLGPLPASPGINRNRYIALMSAITLRENPGETIVTDSCTSNGLATFIQQLGGKHFR